MFSSERRSSSGGGESRGDRGDRGDRGGYNHNNHNNHNKNTGGNRHYDSRQGHGRRGGAGYDHAPVTPSERFQGVVEKLLQGYGFIETFDHDDQATTSLFFHFSEFDGYVEDIRPGNCVEYELVEDRRSGRMVARRVVRIADGSVQKHKSDGIVRQGTVTRLPSRPVNRTFNNGRGERGGRDVDHGRLGKIEELVDSEAVPEEVAEGGVGAKKPENVVTFVDQGFEGAVLDVGDVVEFVVQVHRQTKVKSAGQIKLIKKKPRTQGRISSLKENYGFIDLALTNTELFFHFSACGRFNTHELEPGMEVELDIVKRDNKTMAQNVVVVPAGTVKFVEVDPVVRKGEVSLVQMKTSNQRRHPGSNSNRPDNTSNGRMDQVGGDIVCGGRITFSPEGGETSDTVWFHLRDVVAGEASVPEDDAGVRYGDTVTFQLVKVLRLDQYRAVNVSRVQVETDPLKDVESDVGVITKACNGGSGSIRALGRTSVVRFNMLEMEPGVECRQGDEVTFKPVMISRGEKKGQFCMACRISLLPRGTVKFDTVDTDMLYVGTVVVAAGTQRDAFFSKGGTKDTEPSFGEIRYQVRKTVPEAVATGNASSSLSSPSSPSSSPAASGASDGDEKTGVPAAPDVVEEVGGKLQAALLVSSNDDVEKATPKTATVSYSSKGVADNYQRNMPKVNQQVTFHIARDIHSKKERAVNVAICRDIGRITMLMKNPGYGFVEKGDSDKQFHFRLDDLADQDLSKFNIGAQVEFSAHVERNGKPQAREIVFVSEYPVKLLDSCVGKVIKEVVVGQDGEVEQGQVEYTTKKGIQTVAAIDLSSPLTPAAHFALNQSVRFRLSKGEPTAHLMRKSPERRRALVKAVKQQQFGFIDYKTDSFDTVFFHFSEVESKARLAVGDEVEFTLTVATGKNDTTKATAHAVRLIARAKLPEPTSTWTSKRDRIASPVLRQPYEPLANNVLPFTRPRTLNGVVVTPNAPLVEVDSTAAAGRAGKSEEEAGPEAVGDAETCSTGNESHTPSEPIAGGAEAAGPAGVAE